VALWACNDRKIQTPTPLPQGTTQNFFEQNLNNDLDILFMVDDSSSMTTVQTNLVANFPVFINVLKTLPAGLPNVHLAVTTSNMGAGAYTSSVPGCTSPDLGNFVYAVRAATDPVCQSAKINNNLHFIEALNNASQVNYSGDISDVFRCIAQVGASGCGFEHQLASVRAALGDPMMNLAPPTGNANFLRDDAFLAIIFITNEDDCSAAPDTELFNPNQNSLSDPLGPLASFRCTQFGINCNGQPVPRQAGGPYMNCTSNDTGVGTDAQHRLLPVQLFIDWAKRIKNTPNKVIAAAVAAPTDPFAVSVDPTNGFPTLNHSCGPTANGTFGDPGIRLKMFIDTFGDLGTYTSICDDSYANAMQVIAEKIGRRLGRQCLDGVLADKTSNYTQALATPADGAVVDPTKVSCTVEDIQYQGTPMQTPGTVLRPCNPQGEPAGTTCWALLGDAMCSVSGAKVVVCRNGFDPTNTAKPCPDGGTVPDGDTAIVHCATIAM
jgi:hypothetical protein